MPRTPRATSPTILDLLDEWEIHLNAEDKSKRTIAIYGAAVREFDRFLVSEALPRLARAMTPQHLERFAVWLRETREPKLADSTRFQIDQSLRPFWRYLVYRNKIHASPMNGLKPPRVEILPITPISRAEQEAMLAVCGGRKRRFANARDRALLSFLYDSGVRRGEVAAMQLADIDIRNHVAVVNGKTGHRRVPFGDETARHLAIYVTERRAWINHPTRVDRYGDSPWLWIGEYSRYQGKLTIWGIEQIVSRRAIEAGLGRRSPHQFRHAFAHEFRAAGGQVDDLQRIAGWSPKSFAMVLRYGAKHAEDRALANYPAFSPMDNLRKVH